MVIDMKTRKTETTAKANIATVIITELPGGRGVQVETKLSKPFEEMAKERSIALLLSAVAQQAIKNFDI